jgi:hypothetical protein
MKAFLSAALVAASILPLAAQAAGYGITASVGTTGIGVHVSTALQPKLTARIGGNFFELSHDFSTNDVNYDAKMKLRTVDALLDYFPTASAFRVSAGLVWNGNRFDATGQPTSIGTFTLNGNTYTTAQVGSVSGKVDFRSIAPYLGIGWGNAVGTPKGWSLAADLGVMFQGRPRSNLASSGCSASAVVCAQLATDIAAENQQLQDKLKNFQYYPVVRVGAQYRF